MILEIDGQPIKIDEGDIHLFEAEAWQLDQRGYIFLPHVKPRLASDIVLDSKGKMKFPAKPAFPGRKAMYLHRLIMPPPDGKTTRFRNGDKMDVRRCNLYIKVDKPSIGPAKSKKYAGVYLLESGKWIAVMYTKIDKGGTRRPSVIGHYETEFKAHMARKNYKGE